MITDHKPLETLKVKARTDEILGDLVYYLSHEGRANGPNEFRDEISRGECIQYCEFNCAVKFC